jgi:hypothetical protein
VCILGWSRCDDKRKRSKSDSLPPIAGCCAFDVGIGSAKTSATQDARHIPEAATSFYKEAEARRDVFDNGKTCHDQTLVLFDYMRAKNTLRLAQFVLEIRFYKQEHQLVTGYRLREENRYCTPARPMGCFLDPMSADCNHVWCSACEGNYWLLC